MYYSVILPTLCCNYTMYNVLTKAMIQLAKHLAIYSDDIIQEARDTVIWKSPSPWSNLSIFQLVCLCLIMPYYAWLHKTPFFLIIPIYTCILSFPILHALRSKNSFFFFFISHFGPIDVSQYRHFHVFLLLKNCFPVQPKKKKRNKLQKLDTQGKITVKFL